MLASDQLLSYFNNKQCSEIETFITNTQNQTTLESLTFSVNIQQLMYYVCLINTGDTTENSNIISFIQTMNYSSDTNLPYLSALVFQLFNSNTFTEAQQAILLSTLQQMNQFDYFHYQINTAISQIGQGIIGENLTATQITDFLNIFNTYFIPNLNLFISKLSQDEFCAVASSIVSFYKTNNQSLTSLSTTITALKNYGISIFN